MFFEKSKIKIFIFIIIFFSPFYANANNNLNKKIINYLSELRFFSASFIQNDGTTVSDGKIFIGDKRIRVEYYNPSKILIILDRNKAMYYNYDLNEDEFFDPSDTSAWYFFDIFFNPTFFLDAKIVKKNNYLELVKKSLNDQEAYEIKILFENNPFVIRKIIVNQNDISFILSISDHKHNNSYDEDFFKLINPIFFD